MWPFVAGSMVSYVCAELGRWMTVQIMNLSAKNPKKYIYQNFLIIFQYFRINLFESRPLTFRCYPQIDFFFVESSITAQIYVFRSGQFFLLWNYYLLLLHIFQPFSFHRFSMDSSNCDFLLCTFCKPSWMRVPFRLPCRWAQQKCKICG